MHCTSFTRHALDQHANSHATRKSVRIDDNVRLHAAFAERHVDRRPLLGADTFLTVPRRELVANYRRPSDSKRDVYLLQL